MTKISKKFAFLFATLAAWLLPVFASAQLPMPNPGDMIQLRADDPRCSEGSACFMVGAYRPGGVVRSFERMLEIVNRGRPEAQHVTMQQLDAANECGIMYVRGTGDARMFGANGACARNGTTERVTFESFCRGDRACQRWPYANRPYSVPSVRVLTPDERAEEMAREIANAVDTETVPAPASLGANLRELIELRRSSQPPTDDHEVDVLTAMANALDRTSGATSASAPSDMDFGTGETETDSAEALAHANARIAVLAGELVAARATYASATEGFLPWLILSLLCACFIGVLIMLFWHWFVHRCESEEDKAIDPLEGSGDSAPRGDLEIERDTLDSIVVAVQKIYFDAVGSKVDLRTSEGQLALKERIKQSATVVTNTAEVMPQRVKDAYEKLSGHTYESADKVAKYLEMWVEPLRGLSPEALRRMREDAEGFQKMRDEWRTTPRLSLGFSVENLSTMIGAWLRFEGLEQVWRGMTPAFVVAGNVPDGGLQAYVDGRVETNVDEVLALREKEHEDRFTTERKRAYELVNERIGAKLDELRGEFVAITSGDPGREAVDADLIRSVFSLGRRKMAPFYAFLQGVFDRTTAVRTELDELRGRRENDEAASAPSPSVPPEAVVSVHPDLFGEDGMAALGDTADATPVDPEATRIVRNPVLEAESATGLSELPPEATQPLAQHPDFIDPRGNGEARGDEPTVQVKNSGGRERRDTDRGFSLVAAPPPPTVEPAPSDDSSEGE